MKGPGTCDFSSHDAVDENFLCPHRMEESNLSAFLHDESTAAHGAGDRSVPGDGQVAVAVNIAAGKRFLDSQIVAVDRDSTQSTTGVDVDISTGTDAPVAHGVELMVFEWNRGATAQAHRGAGLLRDALGKAALEAVDVALARPGHLRKKSRKAGNRRVVFGGAGGLRDGGTGGTFGASAVSRHLS